MPYWFRTGIFLMLVIIVSQQGFSQDSLRIMKAVRINEKIKIDGNLDDNAWKSAMGFSGNFYQLQPDNGADASYRSDIYFAYDNKSLYIGALLHDPDPQSIPQELGDRDDFEINVDAFGIIIDTYNQGQSGFAYIVTAAGVQADASMTSRNFDEDWDAVWNSEVRITDEGWVVEVEIPYAAIRFPKKENPVWGINFRRNSKRLNEESAWNFVDLQVEGELNQSGQLQGLKGIKPPLRLSFLPYFSVGGEYDTESSSFSRSLAGGMDMKLGVSESFTLDMSLIPDFSQVQSDNVVLNLSPFEVRFNENRPFFTEGTELFNKGRIFYSRRIGQNRGDVPDEELADNEEIVEFPATTQLINATKLSGRTKSNTGIGVFNAVTGNTYATIEMDTAMLSESGDTLARPRRKYLIEPITNFNVFVVDQSLKNNSYIGLINTNVIRQGDFRDANVTLGDFRFRDRTNTYSISGSAGLSQIFTVEDDERINTQGFRSRLFLSKVSGKIQFNTGVQVESDTWDINDLGFMRRNNRVDYSGRIGYNIFKPFSVFNRFEANLRVNYEQLYKPNTYVQAQFRGNVQAQFRNFYNADINFTLRPFDNYNYFEPREAGYFFKTGMNYNMFGSVRSDRRKKFSSRLFAGFWHRPEDGATEYFGGIGPEYRVNNRLNIEYDLNLNIGRDTKGYVTRLYDDNDDLTDVIFGLRNQNTITNTMGFKYTFTNKMGLNFRLRHYWSWVEHPDFYSLDKESGLLNESNYTGLDEDGLPKHNTTFNAFNIDMVYSWQVAPGSFFTAVYKNQIYSGSDFAEKNFGENLSNTLSGPGTNSLVLKLVYFVDIAYFKKKDA